MIIHIPNKSELDLNGDPVFNSTANYKPSTEQLTALKSGKFKCSCCGMQSRPSKTVPSGYMEAIKIDDKSTVVCRMCYGATHVDGDLDGRVDHGVIIFAPWISQGQLNNLLRLAFVAKCREVANYQNHSDTLYNDFYSLIEAGSMHIGIDNFSGSLQDYTGIFNLLNDEALSKINTVFKGMRYLPSYDAYYDVVRYWDKSTFHKLPTKKWEQMLCQSNDTV